MTKSMTFAEAMRLGSTMYPRCSGFLAKRDARGNIDSVCAIGAAMIAIGTTSDQIFCDLGAYDRLFATYPALRSNKQLQCPECSDTNALLYMACHLNNDAPGHAWPIAKTADWIAAHSEEPEPQPEPPSDVPLEVASK